MKICFIKSKVSKKTFIRDGLVGGFLGMLILSMVFVGLEPALSLAIEDQLTITQVITSEISFSSPSTNVTMTPQLTGITGGTSFGTSTVIVLTNNSAGYTMTITASSSPAMKGYLGLGAPDNQIPDYTSVSSSIPDFAFSVPSGYEFGYTVSASTTADLAQKFLDNGSTTCNTGSADTSGSASCWYGLSTVATSTIVRATQTPGSGSTSSLVFQLKINSGSNVTEDTYQATTTLTATTN